MKVKLKCNLGTNDFPDSPLPEGEHEVTDTFGAKLVALKLAEDITPAKLPPVVVAVTEVAEQPVIKSTPAVADKPKSSKN